MSHTSYVLTKISITVNSEIFARVYFRETSRRFVKVKPRLTLCRLLMPRSRILASRISLLSLFATIKFSHFFSLCWLSELAISVLE